MKLYDGIAALRALVGDSGVFLTSFGATPTAAGDQVIPVAELSMIVLGSTVRIGTGDTAEAAVVTGKSAAIGPGTATLSAPLALAHAAQTPISTALVGDDDYAKYLIQAIRHLSTYRPLAKEVTVSLVAGTTAYALPADFIAPDRESFDEAIGDAGDHRNTQSYYAIVYRQSALFGASGPGSAQTAPANWLVGSSARPPSPNDFREVDGVGLEFRFVKSKPPTLSVKPAPAAARDLTFWYDAMHSLPTAGTDSTLPDEHVHLVLTYAQYLTNLAMSTGACQVMKYELNGEKIDKSKAPSEYRANADAALAKFEAETRFQPLGISG